MTGCLGEGGGKDPLPLRSLRPAAGAAATAVRTGQLRQLPRRAMVVARAIMPLPRAPRAAAVAHSGDHAWLVGVCCRSLRPLSPALLPFALLCCVWHAVVWKGGPRAVAAAWRRACPSGERTRPPL